MENNRVGDEKLLIARSYEGCGKIHWWMWFILESEEQDRSTSGKVNNKWDTREAIDIPNSGFYYKVTIGGRKGCIISGMQ